MIQPKYALLLVVMLTGMVASATGDAPEVEGLTLTEARQLILEVNPELDAAALRVVAADGAARQAGRPPNPSLDLEAENVGGDLPAFAESETTFAVVQTLELGGKRGLRVAEARAARSAAAGEGEVTRRRLLHRLDRSFIGLLAAQERLAIAHGDADTGTAVERAVRQLVEAGEVSPIEATRAEAEAALARAEITRAEAEVQVAAARLGGLLGGARDLRGSGSLERVIELPDGWHLLVEPAELPELRLMDAEIERGEAAVRRVRRSVVPDLDLGAGFRQMRETGDDTFVVSLGLSVPLWDRGRGATAEAEALAAAARRDRDAVLAEVSAALAAARAELAQAEREVAVISNEVLPRAEVVFDAVSDGYTLGKFSLLELLDARRALAGARLRHVTALERQALARADIASLLPEPLAGPGERP